MAYLQDVFLKDEADENLMVHSKDCRVTIATLFIWILWWCLWTPLWMALCCHGRATHFSCGKNLTSWCFSIVVTVFCCHCRLWIYKNNIFLIPQTWSWFLLLMVHIWISSSLSKCDANLLIATWILIHNCGSKIYPSWQFMMRNIMFCTVLFPKVIEDSFTCLFLCMYQHSLH